jgi:hypothetical protein
MKFCKPLAYFFTLAFSQMPIHVSKEVKPESATETILQRWFLRVGTSGRISGKAWNRLFCSAWGAAGSLKVFCGLLLQYTQTGSYEEMIFIWAVHCHHSCLEEKQIIVK